MTPSSRTSDDFRFRVSDVYEIPRRGHMIRLKLLDGSPSMKDLRPGGSLWLEAPDGRGRPIRIVDIGVSSGRARQDRLERTRELDIVVASADIHADEGRVEIGWHAYPPSRGGEA